MSLGCTGFPDEIKDASEKSVKDSIRAPLVTEDTDASNAENQFAREKIQKVGILTDV